VCVCVFACVCLLVCVCVCVCVCNIRYQGSYPDFSVHDEQRCLVDRIRRLACTFCYVLICANVFFSTDTVSLCICA
jgi:hypothetical protein